MLWELKNEVNVRVEKELDVGLDTIENDGLSLPSWGTIGSNNDGNDREMRNDVLDGLTNEYKNIDEDNQAKEKNTLQVKCQQVQQRIWRHKSPWHGRSTVTG